MNFVLPDDLQFMQGHVRDFAQREVATVAAELDRHPVFPWKTLHKMGELGLLGIMTPERYGGSGLDTLSFVVLLEEISAADAAHGTIMSVTNGLPQGMILAYGSDAQKEKYLPKARLGRIHRRVLFVRTPLRFGRGRDENQGNEKPTAATHFRAPKPGRPRAARRRCTW